MKKRTLLWGSLICLAAGAPALAQTPVAVTTPTDASPTPTADYHIGPEDVLDIAVWNNPAMSRTTPVRPDGMISLPLLNDIQAAGLTPMQALTAATSGSARIIRLDSVGTIAPGKAADLLVLDANPLQDIRNTKRLNSVWIAGRRLAAMGTN